MGYFDSLGVKLHLQVNLCVCVCVVTANLRKICDVFFFLLKQKIQGFANTNTHTHTHTTKTTKGRMQQLNR